ncbi:MAG: DUF2474 domain-containing protein [Sphingobium sp.]
MRLDTTERPGPLWRRLLWFAAIWLASVVILAVVAYGIRLVLKH